MITGIASSFIREKTTVSANSSMNASPSTVSESLSPFILYSPVISQGILPYPRIFPLPVNEPLSKSQPNFEYITSEDGDFLKTVILLPKISRNISAPSPSAAHMP